MEEEEVEKQRDVDSPSAEPRYSTTDEAVDEKDELVGEKIETSDPDDGDRPVIETKELSVEKELICDIGSKTKEASIVLRKVMVEGKDGVQLQQHQQSQQQPT